jgi:hypothetical protein
MLGAVLMAGMQVLCMVLAVLVVYSLLSHASAGDVLAVEHARAISAEARVSVQATQIAHLQPTPCPNVQYTYSARC